MFMIDNMLILLDNPYGYLWGASFEALALLSAHLGGLKSKTTIWWLTWLIQLKW